MNRFIIGSIWDRLNRHGVNKNFEYLFEGITRVTILSDRAEEVLKEAQRVNSQNANVQKQLDDLIVNSGTSDAEVVQARGNFSVLGERMSHIDKSFSVIGNFSNDYENLQDAIDATPIGGTLNIQKNEYNIDELIIDKDIIIEANGSKFKANTQNQNLFNASGSRDSRNYTLLNSLKRGDNTLDLKEYDSTLKSGDIIVVKDDSVRFTDKTIDMNLETHEIESVVGNRIKIKGTIKHSKSISSSSNVYKINSINFKLRNFEAELLDGSTYGKIVNCDMIKDLEVSGFKTNNSAGSVVYVKRSINVGVRDFDLGKPLVNESGQGYGIHLYAGVNNFVVRNGKGDGLRHIFDNHSSYTGIVEFVNATNGSSAQFVLSHNGWGGDVTLTNSSSENGLQYGANISGQGVEDETNQVLYGMNIINCKFNIAVENSLNQIGVYSRLPLRESFFRDITITYGNSGIKSPSNTYGLVIPNAESSIVVENITVTDFHWGIEERGVTGRLPEDETLSNYFNNCTVINSSIAYNNTNGKKRNIKLINFSTDKCSDNIFRVKDEDVREFVVDGGSHNNIGGWLFNAAPPTTNQSSGDVRNLNIFGKNILTVTEGKTLNYEEFISYQNNGTLRITSTANVTLHGYPLPDGVFIGDSLVIINVGSYTITVPDSSKLHLSNREWRTLSSDEQITIAWIGNKWIQIS